MSKRKSYNKIRNSIVVAMNKRYSGNTIMADRREEKGGDRNLQQEYLGQLNEELYTEDLD